MNKKTMLLITLFVVLSYIQTRSIATIHNDHLFVKNGSGSGVTGGG